MMKVYYSKCHKKKWLLVLGILSVIYILSNFFVTPPFLLHILLFSYLVLIVISLFLPYLHIQGDCIKSGNNMTCTLKISKLKGVFIVDGEYVFREKNKMLYIDLELVSREDKEKVIKYLNETKLLKTTYDPVEYLFKL